MAAGITARVLQPCEIRAVLHISPTVGRIGLAPRMAEVAELLAILGTQFRETKKIRSIFALMATRGGGARRLPSRWRGRTPHAVGALD